MARASKPKVFLETSVLIRFLTKDDERKYALVLDLLTKIERGEVRPYVSGVVILEVVFVLTKLYGFPRKKVASAVERLLGLRSLVVLEETDTSRALEAWKTSSLPYGDCVIATQVPSGVQLATFDTDFKKMGEPLLYQW